MSDNSAIEWTDATWQPITGCSVLTPGCTNCYAMKLAGTRLRNHPSRAGLTIDTKAGPVWNGEVRFNEQWLLQPLAWRKPRRIFVCAHGDLFHENIPDAWIDRVFAVMALAPQHTFQVLTKRAKRMREWFADNDAGKRADAVGLAMLTIVDRIPHGHRRVPWPLPNVWLGCSTERQQEADERIPDLLQTPAAVRFISAEPLLGPIDLEALAWPKQCDCRDEHAPSFNALNQSIFCDGCCEGPERIAIGKLGWVIVGGESGADARPMHPDWARSLRDQCNAAEVPFFFKQWGVWAPDVGPPATPHRDRIFEGFAACAVWDGKGWSHFENGYQPAPNSGVGEWVYRLGKKSAGRLLDGVEHNDMPQRS